MLKLSSNKLTKLTIAQYRTLGLIEVTIILSIDLLYNQFNRDLKTPVKLLQLREDMGHLSHQRVKTTQEKHLATGHLQVSMAK